MHYVKVKDIIKARVISLVYAPPMQESCKIGDIIDVIPASRKYSSQVFKYHRVLFTGNGRRVAETANSISEGLTVERLDNMELLVYLKKGKV